MFQQVEVRQGLLLVVRNGTEELVCRAAEEGDLTFWEDAIKKAVKDNTRKRAAMMDKARGDVSRIVSFVNSCFLLVFFLSWAGVPMCVAQGNEGNRH